MRRILPFLLVATVWSRGAPGQERRADPSRVYRVPTDGAPARGAREPKVTIVEFGDYHCPYCAADEKVLAEILRLYPDDVRVVFRPVLVHTTSVLPAAAALAAGEQGRYWELHDALFADIRKTRTRDAVDELARALPLDMGKFDAALDDGRLVKRAEAEDALGLRFGVQGTPSFFVNGRFFGGFLRLDQLRPVIDQEIARADALLKKGTKRAALYEVMTRGGDTEAPVVPPLLDPQRRYPVTVGTSPALGSPAAKVTIVEFAEFECPYCLKLHPRLEALVRAYGKEVRLVFKHAPMVKVHPHSRLAARASIAAGSQGKFWEMHDLLFANPKQLERADVDRYAGQLGLDLSRFDHELDMHDGDAQVIADMRLAHELNVTGIPTCFINGRPIVGTSDDDAFRQVIDEELKAAAALIAKGVKPEDVYEKLVPPPASQR